MVQSVRNTVEYAVPLVKRDEKGQLYGGSAVQLGWVSSSCVVVPLYDDMNSHLSVCKAAQLP